MALRENCIYCGSPLTLTAEPRVGPAPRFVYRCSDRCLGEPLSGFFIENVADTFAVAGAFPELVYWALARACP